MSVAATFPDVPDAVRRRMARIKKVDTKPEVMVRSTAHRLGYRFRLHRRDLPGTPDLVFPSRCKIIGVMLQLSEALRANPGETCAVYHMSPGFARQRAIDENGRINELFQGPTRLAAGGYSYPGDSAFHEDDVATVQVHGLDLKQDGAIVAERVPVVAIWLPSRFAIDWIAQHQPT